MSRADPIAVRSGIRAVGRYEVFRPIASGGMATVYLGRLVGTGGFSRTVAVKVMHAHHADNPGFARMFLDEARLAARVRHPNVVQTVDAIEDGEELLLIMEYVPGESLYHLIRAASELAEEVPLPVASRILVEALAGLEAAHTARDEAGEPLNLVHRDVSPQNVLVGVDGLSRLIDFGVAKARGRLQSTQEGQLKGKISYMAPEQIQGRVSARSDIFSASCVLWEAVVGRRLFEGPNEGATLSLLIFEPIPRPETHRADVPTALSEVVMRGLSRDPEERFASASEMAAALAEAVPPATIQTVSTWVRRLANHDLAAREALVRELESTPAALPRPASQPDTTANDSLSRTAVAHGPPDRGIDTRLRTRRAGVAASLLLVLALVGVLTWRLGTVGQHATRPGLAPSAPVSAAATHAPTLAPPDAASSGSPALLPPGATTSGTTAAPPNHSRSSRHGKDAGADATTTNGLKPGCEVPSYHDDAGIIRYKPECF